MGRARIWSLTLIPAILACGASEQELSWQSIDLGVGSLEVRYELPDVAPFGSQRVRFYLLREGAERRLAATDVHNDGAGLGDSNLEVSDLGDGSWQVTLRGQEQADERWVVETTGGEVGMRRLDR